MLESTHVFVGRLAIILSVATIVLSVTAEKELAQAIVEDQDPTSDGQNNRAKWALAVAPMTAVSWGIYAIGALNIEVVTDCCSFVRSEVEMTILGGLFFILYALIFILEVIDLYSVVGE